MQQAKHQCRECTGYLKTRWLLLESGISNLGIDVYEHGGEKTLYITEMEILVLPYVLTLTRLM